MSSVALAEVAREATCEEMRARATRTPRKFLTISLVSFPIANVLTIARIIMIPLVVLLFYLPYSWSDPAAAIVFILAALTDSLDGYLARKLGQTSALGAFLDPVADKLMVATALILLVSYDPPMLELFVYDPHVLITLTAAVIIGREITISALREWMAEIGARGKVAVSWIGKWKTGFQMTGLSLMLFRSDVWILPAFELGLYCLVAAAALTLWSMVMYLKASWGELTR
jgi:CDP-diacylglycerol--glycerol-3-phosphate 3-phosphatidyltransferase